MASEQRVLLRRRRQLGALILVALMAVPQASAGPLEKIDGRVEYASAILRGDTHASAQALSAAHAIASDDVALQGSLNIESSAVFITWFRTRSFGFGDHANNPDASLVGHAYEETSGRETVDHGRVQAEFGSSKAALLIWPNEGDEMNLQQDSSVPITTRPSAGQQWAAGKFQNSTLRNDFPFLVRWVDTVAGQPVVRTAEGGSTWRVRGNFTLVVWGANLTLISLYETATYRTGTWWENATGPGPRGAARDEYAQLVELQFTNATLTWDHRAGIAQWTAPVVATETSGSVSFDQAEGVLQTSKHEFAELRPDLQIEGNIVMGVATHPSSPGRLASALHASEANINMDPGSVIPQPTMFRWTFLPWYLAAAFVLAVLIIGAVRGVRRLGSSQEWTTLLARAEDQLNQGRPSKAARTTRRILRQRLHEGHAWFLYGASLVKMNAFKRVIEELEPMADKVSERASLGFLLGLAHLRLGRRMAALRWFALAQEDPALLDFLKRQPLFAGERLEAPAGSGTNVDLYA